MSQCAALIHVVEETNCPLYGAEDVFQLSGRALSLPWDKAACTTLSDDIVQACDICRTLGASDLDAENGYVFSCSGPSTGCQGVLTLGYKKEIPIDLEQADADQNAAIANMLKNFSMFKSLNTQNLRTLVSLLKMKEFAVGDIVIKQGDPGVNLFIIVSGHVSVLGEDDTEIVELKKGDVFGEMSLLSGTPVGATIRVKQPSVMLFIGGKDFRHILIRFPSLQLYFNRMLTKRLQETNMQRTQDLSAGMIGTLADLPPSELFQTMNQNQKSGVLNLRLSSGEANLYFREGELIKAEYGSRQDTEAFFELLKQTKGRFKFIPELPKTDAETPALGDFMWLIMEGLNRIDENKDT